MDDFPAAVGPGRPRGGGDIGQDELQRHEEFREWGGEVGKGGKGVCGLESKAVEVGEVFSAGFCGVLPYERIPYLPEMIVSEGGIGIYRT